MESVGRVEVYAKVKALVVGYGVLSAAVLGLVAAAAGAGGRVTAFMWVRSGLLLAVAPLLWWLAGAAARGSRAAAGRLRGAVTVLPVAIVAVDLVPGLCPWWFAVAQGVSAVPLAVAAVGVRRGRA